LIIGARLARYGYDVIMFARGELAEHIIKLESYVETWHRSLIGSSGGRPPVSLERMLAVYSLQLWFNLSDAAVGEGLYDSASMRSFAGIDQIWGRYAENR
jgi:transposase, IS5 family